MTTRTLGLVAAAGLAVAGVLAFVVVRGVTSSSPSHVASEGADGASVEQQPHGASAASDPAERALPGKAPSTTLPPVEKLSRESTAAGDSTTPRPSQTDGDPNALAPAPAGPPRPRPEAVRPTFGKPSPKPSAVDRGTARDAAGGAKLRAEAEAACASGDRARAQQLYSAASQGQRMSIAIACRQHGIRLEAPAARPAVPRIPAGSGAAKR